jgi:hypothetical protein
VAQATLENGQENIVRYFSQDQFKALLEFNEHKTECDTLDKINAHSNLNIDAEAALPNAPTNVVHKQFLEELDIVHGLVNHATIFDKDEEYDSDEEDMAKQMEKEIAEEEGGKKAK